MSKVNRNHDGYSTVMTKADDHSEEPKASTVCASCGKKDGVLKKCGACRSVQYCGVECQLSHRKAHKKECRKHAKEIALVDAIVGLELGEEDIVLPPERPDCPICFQVLPYEDYLVKYMECCGKVLCRPCFVASTAGDDICKGKFTTILDCHPDKMEEEMKKYGCAYCRQHLLFPGIGKGSTDTRGRLQVGIAKNDPFAMVGMAREHESEVHDLANSERVAPHDNDKALEMYRRAAALDCDIACYELARVYRDRSCPKESVEYLVKAANLGSVLARREVASLERKAGKPKVAMAHYCIAASAGCKESMRMLTEGYKNSHVEKVDLEAALRCHQNAREDLEGGERKRGCWHESNFTTQE